MIRTFRYELSDESGVVLTGIKTWEEILILNKCLRPGCFFTIYHYPADYPMQHHTALLKKLRQTETDYLQESFLL